MNIELWIAVAALVVAIVGQTINLLIGGQRDEQASLPVAEAVSELEALTGSMGKRLNDVETQNGELRAEVSKLKAMQSWSESMLKVLAQGVGVLVGQIIRIGHEPEWVMPQAFEEWLTKEAKKTAGKRLVPVGDLRTPTLRRMLIKHFDLSELQNLAFELRANYQNFPQTLDDFSRELVVWCERRGRVDDLIAHCMTLRPKVTWPPMESE